MGNPQGNPGLPNEPRRDETRRGEAKEETVKWCLFWAISNLGL